VFRDRIWLLLKHIWYNVGVADIAKEGAAVNPDDAGGMLRVVNVHDVVPDAPSAVRVPFFRCGGGGGAACQHTIIIEPLAPDLGFQLLVV
jgi:hypothetical protein